MSEAVVNVVAPGWFGKIPNLGDFVSRRLPEEFIRAWDDWLQRSLIKAREQLAQDWLSSYLVAPIRRFWIAPGVIGDAAWVGILMPSVDSVGRHFPLTIAMAIGTATPEESLASALSARDWFGAIDEAARQVLDVHFTADELEDALFHVSPFNSEPDLEEFLRDESAHSFDDARELAAAFVDAKAKSVGSVWWCDDPLLATRFAGLPPAASFVSLLNDAATP
jgi:type VI secretion system protein ImpM